MKSRTLSVADSARVFLRAEELFPKFPQTQPTIHARHTFRYRWLFLALAVLSLCAVKAHAQNEPPVPIPPIGKEYGIYGNSQNDVTPLVNNICWANAAYPPGAHFPGYDPFSFATADLFVSDEECGKLTHFPWPPPPAGPPYFFTSAQDCVHQQSEFFDLDPDAMYLDIKYAISVVDSNPSVCNATNKANPTYAPVPFVIPYNYYSPWPPRTLTIPPL